MGTVGIWALLATMPLRAAPASESSTVPGAGTPAELAASLRGILLQFLPEPLYEDHKHWGGQKEVARGLTWKREGPDFHAEVRRSLKNDGLWWRVRVTVPEPAKTVVLDVRDVQKPEPGTVAFTAFVSFGTDIEYQRQRWDKGHRLFSTSIRGRARVILTLRCAAASRLDFRGGFLPDTVFQLRVTASDFRYDDVVFEHVAGVGGGAAKAIGETARSSLRLWRPSLEQHLVEKANAAILKAGDSKEVRIGLGRLFAKR
jgi:hypothetical protein